MTSGERKQCPFCLAYVQMRASGEFFEHRMKYGTCNGSGRTKDDAKEHRRAGAPMTKQAAEAEKPLDDGIPF